MEKRVQAEEEGSEAASPNMESPLDVQRRSRSSTFNRLSLGAFEREESDGVIGNIDERCP